MKKRGLTLFLLLFAFAFIGNYKVDAKAATGVGIYESNTKIYGGVVGRQVNLPLQARAYTSSIIDEDEVRNYYGADLSDQYDWKWYYEQEPDVPADFDWDSDDAPDCTWVPIDSKYFSGATLTMQKYVRADQFYKVELIDRTTGAVVDSTTEEIYLLSDTIELGKESQIRYFTLPFSNVTKKYIISINKDNLQGHELDTIWYSTYDEDGKCIVYDNGLSYDEESSTCTVVCNAKETISIGMSLIDDEYNDLIKVTVTEDGSVHYHDWDGGVVTKQPTCTEKGVKTYSCTCGETKTEDIPATGHKTVVRNQVAASYASAGYTGDVYCSVCGALISKGQATSLLTLSAPALQKVKAAKKAFVVKYTPAAGASGIQVQYSLKKSMAKAKTKTVSGTTAKLSKLSSKKKYYVRVRSYVKTANGKVYSAWSGIKAVKTK